MFYVVYYHEDNVFHVCKTSEIRYVRGKLEACYTNQHWYRASCIFKTLSMSTAKAMVEQLCASINIRVNVNERSKVSLKYAICCDQPPLVIEEVSCLDMKPVVFEFAKNIIEPEHTTKSTARFHTLCNENDLSFPEDIYYHTDHSVDNDTTSNLETSSFLFSQNKETENVQHTRSVVEDDAMQNKDFQEIEPLLLDKCPRINILSNIIIEDVSQPPRKLTKREFCIFCKSLKSNISRHFTTVHKNEEEVKKLLYLPNKSVERQRLIAKLRKQGQFMFNTDNSLNQGEFLSVSRRNIKNHAASHYRVCPSCKGYYARNSIRQHIRLCAPQYFGEKCTVALSRKLEGKVHHLASDVLKNTIIPYMRNDIVTNTICYDTLATLTANSWCRKYKWQKDNAMIRSRLRLLGRFLIAMRSISSHVKELSDIFKPQLYEQVVIGINQVARFKEQDATYCAPSTAHDLGGLLKKVAEIYKIKLISEDSKDQLTNLNNFLTIFNHEIRNDVNRTVRENICESRRRKPLTLPKTGEIKKLSDYLHSNIEKYERLLRESTTLLNYKELASFLVIDLQVFNRRRAGELERLLINDFNAQISQSESPGYVCVEIRGKLMRTVPLLISNFNNKCIKLLLQCRAQFGIRSDNPYVFALPSGDDRPKYIRACHLLRQYSTECNVSYPNLLRGTLLRKHAATYASQLNFNDSQVQNLAEHLGHETKIFREIYSQPIIKKQLSVATFLQDAQGLNKDDKNISDLSLQVDDVQSEVDVQETNREETTLLGAGYMEFENSTLRFSNDKYSTVTLDKDCSAPTTTQSSNSNLELHEATPVTPANSAMPKRTSSGRHSWSSEEKSIIRNVFSEHIKTKTSPSFYEICMARESTQELQCVSETQILGCVNNVIAQEKRKLFFNDEKKVPKRWNNEEIDIVKKCFQNYIEQKQLPSLTECRKCIENNPQLQSRTPSMVKAWINNYIRKKTKKPQT